MTIIDIAKLAGVGVSTVSRVINNHPDVKKETRERVLEVIRENNYVPNNSARVLKQTNTKNIGVLVKGVFNPFFSALLKDISAGIERAGYSVILYYHNDTNDLAALLSFIKEKRLQGVICIGGNFVEVTEESFEGLDVAIVMLCIDFNTPREWKNFSTVSIRNESAAYKAITYLIDKGHREIGIMLGDEKDLSVGELRYAGYKRACLENGLEIKDEYIVYGKYDASIAYKEAKVFVQNHSNITAIFVTSDMMAIGVAKAIADLGLKVGHDVSVMGFDGMDVAAYYEPTIATMKQPQDELASASINLLIDLLNDKTGNKHILLDTELIEGASVRDLRLR